MNSKRFGKVGALLVVGAGLVLLGQVSLAQDEKGFEKLFNGKDLTGWKTIVGGKGDPSKTFTVEDGMIVVSGRPNGYFYTDKSYNNYVLRFDWKFSKPGNSGLLVHITGKQKVWPKCVEVQGMLQDHGRIFAIGGAKGKFTVDKAAQKKAIKGPGVWHTTEVICKDGQITSKVNGIQVSTGEGELTEGPFGFQSEGTKLYFKNIRLKKLD